MITSLKNKIKYSPTLVIMWIVLVFFSISKDIQLVNLNLENSEPLSDTAISLQRQHTTVSSGGEFLEKKKLWAHKNWIRLRTSELDHFSNIL